MRPVNFNCQAFAPNKNGCPRPQRVPVPQLKMADSRPSFVPNSKMARTSLTTSSGPPRTPCGPQRQVTRASAGSEGKSASARGACAEGCRRCEAGGTWDRPQDWDCYRGRHGARRSPRSSCCCCRRCPNRDRRAAAAGNAAKEGEERDQRDGGCVRTVD